MFWTHHLRVLNLSWRLALYHLFLYDKDLPVKKGLIISAFHKSKPCKHIIKMFAPFLDTFKTFTILKTNQILLLCFLKLLHLLISQFWNSSRKMIYSSLAKTWGWKRTKRRIFLESTDTTLRQNCNKKNNLVGKRYWYSHYNVKRILQWLSNVIIHSIIMVIRSKLNTHQLTRFSAVLHFMLAPVI